MIKDIAGEFVKIKDKEYYKISNYDELEPFLFSIVTSNDIWIHLSSNGCICAGRENNEKSLFPYISDDKMYHSDDTGAKSLIKVKEGSKTYLWQPFLTSYIKQFETERNIYKSILGNSVIFEEINHDLGVAFRYKWECVEKYGIVRSAELENLGKKEIEADVCDGLLNILPAGVHPTLQANWSCLVDGYKKTELFEDTTLALFSLTMPIGDTPSPEVMLKTNIVFSQASFETKVYLDEKVLLEFSKNMPLTHETAYCGDRGAYIINFKQKLAPNEIKDWKTIADVEFDHQRAAELIKDIKENNIDIERELEKSEEDLKNVIAKADGFQCTGDKISYVHHLSNVTFNNMRGGLFLADYDFEYEDFLTFVKIRNQKAYEENQIFFEDAKKITNILDLKEKARNTGKADVIRLCYEYLPISFSRRHGDPSRPWNKFNIVLKDKKGKPITNYEGNWRDIFQNWEAMCLSFPEYLDSIVAKFLNATTPDGFNSYRITKEGIDWERMNPDDPCASLGYWGDHQIIYFSRLLEWLEKFNPENLRYLIKKGQFSYANIPYEVNLFDDLIKDPEHTIVHRLDKDDEIMKEVAKFGTDYKLLTKNGEIFYAGFAEKAIVPVLSKISNLVLGGGIWMNTQRPEWNDANNAIVGFGLSVVTACQLKRHLSLLSDILKEYKNDSFIITEEVFAWLCDALNVLRKYQCDVTENKVSKHTRMSVLKELGYAFDKYKKAIYNQGFTGKTDCGYEVILEFLQLSESYIDYTIKENKREDGLYHSYNIMHPTDDEIEITHLKVMLEGQVAVLGCDFLTDQESAELLRKMEESELYSEREKTYYLYPIIHTKGFMDKNIIPKEYAETSMLLKKLIEKDNTTLIKLDYNGNIRFNRELNSFERYKSAIDGLKANPEYTELVEKEEQALSKCYDDVFGFSEFMGRSQVLYKYEGIGSVYWHQNSKLLVSALERMLKAEDKKELKKLYRTVRSGLGFNKTPKEWRAFPQDAYSHTPFGGGAKQPGMTGQVKEEIITRFAELGVIIEDSKIKFRRELIDDSEFLKENTEFQFIRIDNERENISLKSGSLALTFCQTPIVYEKADKNEITVSYINGEKINIEGNVLPEDISESVFKRENRVKCIRVLVK